MATDDYSFRVEFDDYGKAISLYELSSYLYHLKSLYSFLFEQVLSGDPELAVRVRSIIEKGEGFRPDIIHRINQQVLTIIEAQGYDQRFSIYRYYIKDLGHEDIVINKISRESPLIIVFGGVAVVLTIAFIICGGEFELSMLPPKIKVKMGPIGEGLEKIKNLIRR